MKTTHLVKNIGSSSYLRYNRMNLLNFLAYANAVDFDLNQLVSDRDFKKIDKMLKSKITSYYAAKHDGFMSLAEYYNGKPIVELSSMVSEARRDFKVKPASWFKTEDAYKILSTLKNEHGKTKVLDPFHGWGSRAMAAKCLSIDYVGIDANTLLHEELKRIDSSLNIYNENSFEFNYQNIEFDCIFTCPPYWKCEDYGYRIGYGRTYDIFLNDLCNLFYKLSDKAKVQIVSLENFIYDKSKFEFESDFVEKMSKYGCSIEEVVYREMKRSFNDDIRKLKYFLIRF